MRTFAKAAGLYVASIVAVIASACFSYQYISASAQAHIDAPRKHQMTKLDEMAQNAREIRQAIANAKHTIDPLPPITSKTARQLSHSRAQSDHGKLAERRLSNEARNAFAASYARPAAKAIAYDRHSVH